MAQIGTDFVVTLPPTGAFIAPVACKLLSTVAYVNTTDATHAADFTVRKNTVATTSTVTIAATTQTSNTDVHSQSFAAGDQVDLAIDQHSGTTPLADYTVTLWFQRA